MALSQSSFELLNLWIVIFALQLKSSTTLPAAAAESVIYSIYTTSSNTLQSCTESPSHTINGTFSCITQPSSSCQEKWVAAHVFSAKVTLSSHPMLAPQEGFLPVTKIASSEGAQRCKQSLLKEIDLNPLLRKFSPVVLCLKASCVSDGANRICIIIWSLGGLETLAIAQATQNTDCRETPLQRWVCSDVVSLWWDHLYCLFNYMNTGSKKCTVINQSRSRMQKWEKNNFSL